MGQPDSTDLQVRVPVPFTQDDVRQYEQSQAWEGLWLTYAGFKYTEEYVYPGTYGTPPEEPEVPPMPDAIEPQAAPGVPPSD